MATPAAATAAEVIELPSPDGVYIASANDVNDRGTTVGDAWLEKTIQAAQWSSDGRLTLLPSIPQQQRTSADAINSHGTIVGNSGRYAVQWGADATITQLGWAPSTYESYANDINDSGTIVGTMRTMDAGTIAVKWIDPKTPTKLSLLPGQPDAYGLAINKTGVAVGQSGDRAVRWTADGDVQALQVPANAVESSAWELNDRGEAVGYVRTTNDPLRHAVRWDVHGNVAFLPQLPGDGSSMATDINNNGVVVGYSDSKQEDRFGVRWAADNSVTELGPLPGDYGSFAKAINDNDWIVGESDSNVGSRAVRWSTSSRS